MGVEMRRALLGGRRILVLLIANVAPWRLRFLTSHGGSWEFRRGANADDIREARSVNITPVHLADAG